MHKSEILIPKDSEKFREFDGRSA